MAADFVSGRRLAGPQQDDHRPGGGDIIDVDRHKAVFILMRVEQGRLLMAGHPVERVVDARRTTGSTSNVTAAGGRAGLAQPASTMA